MLKRRRRGVYEIDNVVYIMSHVAYQQSKDLYLYYKYKTKMTTADLKNDQLPNNRLEVFKSNTNLQVFKPTNSKLILVASEMISKGLVKTSLDFAEKFMFTFDSKETFPINIEVLMDMKVYDRKDNCKTKLNKNFILDTDFKVQKATPELSGVTKKGGSGLLKENIMLTVDCFKSMCMLANSETGKQVKNYYLDLEKIFKEYILRDIKLLTQEKEQAIQEKETINRRLSSVTQNHNKMLKRRRRGVYEIGNVVYILSHVAFTSYYQDDYYKIGISTQSMTETTPAFKNRLALYKQGAPCDYKVHYLIYVENNKLIEDILKLKFKNQLNPSNGEWIKGVKLEEIIKSIRYLCDYIGLPCKEHSIMKNKNIVDDGKVLDYENEEDIEETKLLSDKFTEIEIIETDEENTDSEQEDSEQEDSEQEDDGESEVKQVEMIDEIEKYDAKQLTKMLLQFELPVSGNKDAKKRRIREYAKKNKTIVEEYISNAIELPKQNFCIDCGTEITYKAARCEPCCRKSSRVVIDRPDYQTLKKQYEDCGKNMKKLARIHNVSDKAVTKWFDKYEKELCIINTCRKKIKPKSTIIKPSDEDLLYDKNVLKLNYTQLGKKYNVDRTTARDWLSTL